MAERPKRCAIMLEADLYYRAVSLSGDTRDGNPTRLVRRLIKEEEERQRAMAKKTEAER